LHFSLLRELFFFFSSFFFLLCLFFGEESLCLTTLLRGSALRSCFERSQGCG
jgi:hypothetical protein